MSEIVFVVEVASEGALTARALGHSIFIEATSYDELREQACDAMRCHFDAGELPAIIRFRAGTGTLAAEPDRRGRQ